jgi:hypothetical protein
MLPPVLADDIVPPVDWVRGDDRTTYQRWEFPDNNPTPPPSIYVNEYGIPSTTVTNGAWQPIFDGRVGVWTLGLTTPGSIVVDIPNADGGIEKEVWLQLTYETVEGLPDVTVDGTLGEVIQTIPVGPQGFNWFHTTWSFLLDYNPRSEQVIISGMQVAVDELVIDTICRLGQEQVIPEPATLTLLGLGVLAVVRRRRRR